MYNMKSGQKREALEIIKTVRFRVVARLAGFTRRRWRTRNDYGDDDSGHLILLKKSGVFAPGVIVVTACSAVFFLQKRFYVVEKTRRSRGRYSIRTRTARQRLTNTTPSDKIRVRI